MFETLQDKLQGVFDQLSRRGRLTEKDVDTALREVRLALLEADVNFKVTKNLVARIRERAIGVEVTRSLSPAQQVIKIVNEELITTLGEPVPLNLGGSSPRVIMLVGLQGAGKTTMVAKLGLHLRRSSHRPLLVAADTRRPAAIEQLRILGKQLDIPVYDEGTGAPPPTICANALKAAREGAYSVVIVDTSGRLQIDEALMEELVQIEAKTDPQEILLVVDAMTGQDAVKVATGFNEQVDLSGLILTKIDGDARGGAAISVREVTGVPIKFLGTGEKLNELEVFYPDRMASRILGMGDVLTLIERAEASMDEEMAQEAADKLLAGKFDLDDFLKQLQQVKKMGPLGQVMELVPGLNKVAKDVSMVDAEKQMGRTEAIINSMTLKERRNPRVLNASRKRRVARGSGTSVQEVNQLISQFRQMQKMMKDLRNPRKLKSFMSMLDGLR
ncbi:MAG: signal recognition particle protein [Phycisphaerae bacterium]|nr:signal recognition particle protein [Phycisphaerae bacterium]NIU25914.1 signal recognition particle protein [candidate division KSB1 bacterium]NIV00550.1 signal recognition particle protein [Phycisphaerae bacterium]NIV71142.1 signal recognition particle protein [Phycisphaerae bacterium]NIX32736.1 signal recognition particle protein [Phycisphaerae bacterium]